MMNNKYLQHVRSYGARVYMCETLTNFDTRRFPVTTSYFGYRNVWVDGHAFIGFKELTCFDIVGVRPEHENFADQTCKLTDGKSDIEVLLGEHFLDQELLERLSEGEHLPNAVLRTNGERIWLAHYGFEKPKLDPRPRAEPMVIGLFLNPEFGW